MADFIGETNIIDGVMHKDFLVEFAGRGLPLRGPRLCPGTERFRWSSARRISRWCPRWKGQLVGVVDDVIFKGVHYEMHVECEGHEWLIHSTRACTPGETIGMRIGPNEIHIMAHEG